MHSSGVSEQILETLKRRRGDVRLFRNLKPGTMALLVIDMLNCFCAPGGAMQLKGTRDIVPNINRLARACRTRGIPVIWMRHANQSDGGDWRVYFDHFLSADRRALALQQLSLDSWGTRLWEGLDVHSDDVVLTKCRYSPFIPGSSSLERLLRSMGKDTVIITGTETNVCCESAARDAMMLDFKVLFVSDATAAATDEEHQAALHAIIQYFGDVLTTDDLVAEIEGYHAL